jgi:hypothetical protein
MATADDLRRIALSLDGTVEAPHMDRRAFKVARIYATLPPDERTANFKFAPEEQEFKQMLAPHLFAAVANGFGRMGWTTGQLAAMSEDDLADALQTAWTHAQPKPQARRRWAPRSSRTCSAPIPAGTSRRS